jgi:3-deoxy-manno-octulosonate cytidylyltransferase (CMP-KDO synthetase)
MRVAAVIPARYQSSRFPGKPLAVIAGRTMIERVYRQAQAAQCFTRVIVATDDPRIRDEAARFGGEAEMTDINIKSGSERVWAVAERLDVDAVVNVQGDEPLIPPALVREVALALEREPVVSAARFNHSHDDFLSRHVVKVVCDARDRALYFSRSPIPFAAAGAFPGFRQHIGIYGYSREALRAFCAAAAPELERQEGLEQLRFLCLGLPIRIVMTEFVAHGVDVPADVDKIERMIRS